VTAYLRRDGLPLVTGGRSYGARIACRTAEATGADGVLCLAFPLQPRGSAPSRQPELSAVPVPTLVVQGRDDPFGVPGPSRTARVVVVGGDHSLRRDHAEIRHVVGEWLAAFS
jgi:predicted alpha/beta-hydrolase family hydrolase